MYVYIYMKIKYDKSLDSKVHGLDRGYLLWQDQNKSTLKPQDYQIARVLMELRPQQNLRLVVCSLIF